MHHAAGQRSRFVDFDAHGRGARDGRRPTGRSARRRRPERACRRRSVDLERPALLRGEIAEKSLDRMDADRRIELRRDCRRLRTDGSRPGHARPASGCRAPASPRPRDTCPPAPGRARPGCSRRPGRRGCRAAADRHRSAAGRAPARSPSRPSDPRSASCPAASCCSWAISPAMSLGARENRLRAGARFELPPPLSFPFWWRHRRAPP